MGPEEYLSLMFVAMASLGVIFVSPFVIESVIFMTVIIILAWKWIYEGILSKIGIQDWKPRAGQTKWPIHITHDFIKKIKELASENLKRFYLKNKYYF